MILVLNHVPQYDVFPGLRDGHAPIGVRFKRRAGLSAEGVHRVNDEELDGVSHEAA